MALGKKTIETRSWPTSYRGDLAIHASLKWDKALQEELKCDPFYYQALGFGKTPTLDDWKAAMQFGEIVAVVRLNECLGSALSRYRAAVRGEEMFGDYAPGRHGFLTDTLRVPTRSIPMRGRQGMWILNSSERKAIEALLGPAKYPLHVPDNLELHA